MLQRKQWGHGGDALLGQRLRLVHNGQVLCERGVVGLLHQHEIHQVLQQRRWGGGGWRAAPWPGSQGHWPRAMHALLS